MTKKVENYVPWTYVTEELHGEETVGTFPKKKAMMIILTVELIKKA